MRVELSARADAQLDGIAAFLTASNPEAARSVLDRIRQVIDLLADFPSLGPVWQGGTRAVLVTGLPYRVHYRVEADRVVVVTIAHVRQRPPF